MQRRSRHVPGAEIADAAVPELGEIPGGGIVSGNRLRRNQLLDLHCCDFRGVEEAGLFGQNTDRYPLTRPQDTAAQHAFSSFIQRKIEHFAEIEQISFPPYKFQNIRKTYVLFM